VQSGKFREDLFYRLHVIVIKVPPLRERLDDIPQLVDYFVNYYNKSMGRKIRTIDKRIYNVFRNYDWPGNVRQLQNTIERGVSFAKGDHLRLEDMDLNDAMRGGETKEKSDFRDPIKAVKYDAEKKLILLALARFQGNKTKTAEYLGIQRPLLYQKMKRLGIR